MKVIFYDYENEERVDILETEMDVLPKKDDCVSFPWNGKMHYAYDVYKIEFCFGLDKRFSHIDIELYEP